jgi:hypothetical protein
VRFTSFARSRAVVAARNPPRGTRPSRSRYRLSPRVLAGDAYPPLSRKPGGQPPLFRQGQLLRKGVGGENGAAMIKIISGLPQSQREMKRAAPVAARGGSPLVLLNLGVIQRPMVLRRA